MSRRLRLVLDSEPGGASLPAASVGDSFMSMESPVQAVDEGTEARELVPETQQEKNLLCSEDMVPETQSQARQQSQSAASAEARPAPPALGSENLLETQGSVAVSKNHESGQAEPAAGVSGVPSKAGLGHPMDSAKLQREDSEGQQHQRQQPQKDELAQRRQPNTESLAKSQPETNLQNEEQNQDEDQTKVPQDAQRQSPIDTEATPTPKEQEKSPKKQLKGVQAPLKQDELSPKPEEADPGRTSNKQVEQHPALGTLDQLQTQSQTQPPLDTKSSTHQESAETARVQPSGNKPKGALKTAQLHRKSVDDANLQKPTTPPDVTITKTDCPSNQTPGAAANDLQQETEPERNLPDSTPAKLSEASGQKPVNTSKPAPGPLTLNIGDFVLFQSTVVGRVTSSLVDDFFDCQIFLMDGDIAPGIHESESEIILSSEVEKRGVLEVTEKVKVGTSPADMKQSKCDYYCHRHYDDMGQVMSEASPQDIFGSKPAIIMENDVDPVVKAQPTSGDAEVDIEPEIETLLNLAPRRSSRLSSLTPPTKINVRRARKLSSGSSRKSRPSSQKRKAPSRSSPSGSKQKSYSSPLKRKRLPSTDILTPFAFILTSFDGKEAVQNEIETNGGRVVDIDELVSLSLSKEINDEHLAVISTDNPQIRKRKLLIALACGIPILHKRWIEEVCKSKGVQPVAERHMCRGLHLKSPITFQSDNWPALHPFARRVFRDYVFCMHRTWRDEHGGDVETDRTDSSDSIQTLWEEVVHAGGGMVLPPPASAQHWLHLLDFCPGKQFVVLFPDHSSKREQQSFLDEMHAPQNVASVTRDWVIDCLRT